MTHNANVDFAESKNANFPRAAFQILNVVGGFFRAIVSSNRFAKEVEDMLHASDRKLADQGLTRTEVVSYLARTSQNCPAI